jgi:cysteine desulfurase / selenocysteine lyase
MANPLEVFLDSAASSQKPAVVLAILEEFYRTSYANIHRGVYALSEAATDRYERARATVAKFIGAIRSEIVFTKNSTEAINLMANGLAELLHPGDVVLCSKLEHHSNFLPWLAVAQRRGATVRFIPVSADGVLVLDDLDKLFAGVRILAITGMSNVTGEIVDLAPLVEAAHSVGALVVVDGAQLVPHHPVNVAGLGVDALVFSGHKLGGPSGIGALWAKRELLERMPPFLLGGGMIETVTETGFTSAAVPEKFEAGTPPIAEAVALAAALDYLTDIGMDAVRAHERHLVSYALGTLSDRFGERIRIYGPTDPAHRGGVFSFTFAGIHPHDVGQILNEHHVSVRAGHHCAQPLMRALKVPATTRASVWIYNGKDDIDALADGLDKVVKSGLVL